MTLLLILAYLAVGFWRAVVKKARDPKLGNHCGLCFLFEVIVPALAWPLVIPFAAPKFAVERTARWIRERKG